MASKCGECGSTDIVENDAPEGCVCFNDGAWMVDIPGPICDNYISADDEFDDECETCEHDKACHTDNAQRGKGVENAI